MLQSPLKGLKKPKGLKKLKGLGKTVKTPEMEELEQAPERMATFVDEELERWSKALGSEQLAKKLRKLAGKYPDATLPELVAIEWLERRGHEFTFQQSLLGGRVLKGGQVVDLVVDQGLFVLIWEVQGTYWHTRPGNLARDYAQKMALLGLTVFGKPVKAVVALWEDDLVNEVESRRNGTLQRALAGIESSSSRKP